MAGEVKKQQVSEGVSVTTPTDLATPPSNNETSAISANTTIGDDDNVKWALVTTGTPSFTFVDGDVSTGADTITEPTHGLADGTPVRFENSGGELPTGIAENQVYFVINTMTNTFQISTVPGGGAVDITAAAGGGTHTCRVGINVTLPTASDNSDRECGVKRVDGGLGGFAVLSTESGDTIDGGRFKSVDLEDQGILAKSDGSNWETIGIRSPKNRWAKKLLTSDFSTNNSEITDLTFSNLTLGKVYRYSGVLLMIPGTPSNTAQYITIFEGTTKVRRLAFVKEAADDNRSTLTFSHTFCANQTSVKLEMSSDGTVDAQTSDGSGQIQATWVEIEELNNYGIETSDFD